MRRMLPIVVTLILVAVAVIAGQHMWRYYYGAPWTRDAHIRADVLQIAPDVTGLVTEVFVHDNETVKRDQPLFVIDRARYTLAERQAEAVVGERRATLAQLKRESARNHQLSDLVAQETVEEGRAKVAQAEALLHAAEVALDTARLNLERTTVRAPSDGYLNDRVVRTGDYVNAGHAVFAMVDENSFHVDGYFEETHLHGVQIGQAVTIHVMGEKQVLRGRVQSIAAGIADRERSASSTLLPDINPTFNWVRLAQRIPVRIAIDGPIHDVRLIAGRTATVIIQSDDTSNRSAVAEL